MATNTTTDTRTRLLDVAEELFAREGLAVSLRHIIAEAGVNLAAVHYHFGSKAALIQAVFARRLEPLNQRRLELLDAAERAAGRRAVPVEKIVEAMILPVLETALRNGEAGRVILRLFGRVLAEPDPKVTEMVHQQFGEVLDRFRKAFQRALPQLSPKTIAWRIHFAIGAMAHTMCAPERLAFISGGRCRASDPDVIRKQLVAFVAAGMRAPEAN